MTTRITRKNLDGTTIETETTTTRSVKDQLLGKLTFAEKLELMYPTTGYEEIVKGWESFDEHKFYK